MVKAGRLIYQGLLAAWDGFWIVWLSDVLWLILCLPIITIPYAFSGLYACTHGLAYGESLDWKSFFSGAKRYLGTSLRWTGFNLLVILVLVFYIWFFYTTGRSLFPSGLEFLIYIPVVLIFFWWIINMYTFPFMLAQQKPSYIQALRNSLVLFLKWPGIALGFSLINLAVIALSILLRFPWIVLGASLPALLACVCVKYVISQTLQSGTFAEI
jgi:hypothetical protein